MIHEASPQLGLFLGIIADVCHPAEKPGAAPAPAEAPAATPAKTQDNLFFIEEPKPVRVPESESVLPLRG